MKLNVTYYKLPDGELEQAQIDALGEDAIWFNSRGYSVSAEHLTTGQLVLYSTTGLIVDDEACEAIHLCLPAQSSQAAVRALRKVVEELTGANEGELCNFCECDKENATDECFCGEKRLDHGFHDHVFKLYAESTPADDLELIMERTKLMRQMQAVNRAQFNDLENEKDWES